MIIGAYIDIDGQEKAKIYDLYEQFYKDTFSPETEPLFTIDFVIHGKTYAERKGYLEQMAKDYQSAFTYGLSPSWLDLSLFNNYFETNGRRYGLLKEFQENGIC